MDDKTHGVLIDDTLSDEEYERFKKFFDTRLDAETHAFGTDHLELKRENGIILLTGLTEISEEMAKAGVDYLTALAEFSRQTIRVNRRTPSKDTSEKYSFRVWLNRIGLKGDDHKATRKTLLKNLTGSSSRAREGKQ